MLQMFSLVGLIVCLYLQRESEERLGVDGDLFVFLPTVAQVPSLPRQLHEQVRNCVDSDLTVIRVLNPFSKA